MKEHSSYTINKKKKKTIEEEDDDDEGSNRDQNCREEL